MKDLVAPLGLFTCESTERMSPHDSGLVFGISGPPSVGEGQTLTSAQHGTNADPISRMYSNPSQQPTAGYTETVLGSSLDLEVGAFILRSIL